MSQKSMAAEQILELFDSFWLETTVLRKKNPPSSSSTQNTYPDEQVVIRSFTDHRTMASTTSPSFSGKEVNTEETIKEKTGKKVRCRPGKRGSPRSSLELEIVELKGFMDLGFVFSEEDKGSWRLVALIPGLQRMGRRREEEESWVCRPYLSEAWGVLDQRKEAKQNPLLLNWKVPSFSSTNEIEMKHNLRFCAHSVASIITSQ